MSIRIVPPSTAKGRLALQRAVASLHQQGLEVGAFAQFFWTMARGLEYSDSTLKEAFNLCLDDPLPQWEMEQLRGIDFWTFSKYLHHRKDWQILTPPESACRDDATFPPKQSQIQDPLPSPTLKRRLRRKRAVKTAVPVSESTELTAVSVEALTTENPRAIPVIPKSVQSSPVIPEPDCRDQPALLPSLSQVPDHLLTPRKHRARRKSTAQNAASVSESVKSAPVIQEPVQPTPVSPEPIQPAPDIPEPVKSDPVIPEPVKTGPFIPEVAKSAAITFKVVKLNAVNSEAAANTLLCPRSQSI